MSQILIWLGFSNLKKDEFISPITKRMLKNEESQDFYQRLNMIFIVALSVFFSLIIYVFMKCFTKVLPENGLI